MTFLRGAVRLRTVGFRGFKADDYLSVLVCEILSDSSAVSVTHASIVLEVGLIPVRFTHLVPGSVDTRRRDCRDHILHWWKY